MAKTTRKSGPRRGSDSTLKDVLDLERMKKDFAPENVAIIYRHGTKAASEEARKLASWLTERDFKVFAAPGQKLLSGNEAVSKTTLPKLDWVIALGGDGTYLKAVRMIDGRQIPILGVNMGSLGFLTEIRLEELYKAIEQTLKKKMEFQPRSMLKIEVRRRGKRIGTHLALNDVVLERGTNTHLINIEIYSQKQFVASVKADALIVASPTGSTAYNLAAGGPILHPEVRAIVVTPVSPHTLTSRPLVFPENQHLSFKLAAPETGAGLTVDGMNFGEIGVDDEVIVVANEVAHLAIRKASSNFFDLLREKLSFGRRD